MPVIEEDIFNVCKSSILQILMATYSNLLPPPPPDIERNILKTGFLA